MVAVRYLGVAPPLRWLRLIAPRLRVLFEEIAALRFCTSGPWYGSCVTRYSLPSITRVSLIGLHSTTISGTVSTAQRLFAREAPRSKDRGASSVFWLEIFWGSVFFSRELLYPVEDLSPKKRARRGVDPVEDVVVDERVASESGDLDRIHDLGVGHGRRDRCRGLCERGDADFGHDRREAEEGQEPSSVHVSTILHL